jgi:hypothetical protein
MLSNFEDRGKTKLTQKLDSKRFFLKRKKKLRNVLTLSLLLKRFSIDFFLQ